MNTPTTFQPAADGWFHIAPHGTFPHPTGALQVIDAEACEAMLGTFTEEARQPNFPGLLVDFDHSSHDPAQPTTAAGWISGLEHRGDGLYAQIRWSDLGHQALTGGRYRLASPVWNRAECDQWTAPAGDGREVVHLRPRRLDRLALTNDPNLPGMAPLSNRRDEGRDGSRLPSHEIIGREETRVPTPNENMNLRTEIIQQLHLPGTAGVEEMVAALRAQTTELETLRKSLRAADGGAGRHRCRALRRCHHEPRCGARAVAREPGRHAGLAERIAPTGGPGSAAPAAAASAQPAFARPAGAGAPIRPRRAGWRIALGNCKASCGLAITPRFAWRRARPPRPARSNRIT